MAVDKFKFVSPGIFIDEIDESILEPLPERMGPMIIGRFQKGPGMRPVKVNSFKEFVSIFGAPAAGNPEGDIWRDGEMTAPTYAAYAAQAWLKNNQPATIYRVLGEHSKDFLAGSEAGWKTAKDFSATGSSAAADIGGAYGLFVMPNPDSYTSPTNGASATCTIKALSDTVTGSEYGTDGSMRFTLTSYDGTEKIYAIYKSGPQSTGGTGYGYTHIQLQGSNNIADVTEQIANAINHSNGHADKLLATRSTVTNTNDTITVTNVTGGFTGNKTIPAITGGSAAALTINGGIAATAFSGGGVSGAAVTGTLAAVWYMDEGAPLLYGTARNGDTTPGNGQCARLVKGTNGSFTVKISGSTGITKSANFNFQKDSQNFIRKVFNTNPTLTTDDCTELANRETYWLGETFESNINSAQNSHLAVTGSTPASSDQLGVILALDGTGESGIVWGTRKQKAKAAETGWFFSQDIDGDATTFNPLNGTRVVDLFKFVALDSGEHANRDYKISIMDIKPPTDSFNDYGTFTVLVRGGKDNDNMPTILERFSSINLNPNSLNYIGRVIGDRHYSYSETNKTITDLGNYPNRSKYVRVKMSADIEPGNRGKEGLLPYGVRGPVVPATQAWTSGSNPPSLGWYAGHGDTNSLPSFSLPALIAQDDLVYAESAFTASIQFPTTRLRVSSSEGSLSKGTKAFFGYQSNLKNTRRHDNTNSDLLRGQPSDHDPFTKADTNQYSWVFTLDDLCPVDTDMTHAYWASGSRASSLSWTAKSGSTYVLTGSNGGFNRFTTPMFGGFDGFDVTERDPLRNSGMTDKTNLNSPSVYSFFKAIDVISDAEFVEYDIACMPGVTKSSLNTKLINMCEERADALAIVDLEGNYKPPHETIGEESANLGSVEDVVNAAKDMGLNTSYGCTFYPFVQIRDTLSDSILYVPPSVVALGTFSSSQRKSAVWFAPAGFTRGGLSEGSSGLPVLGVRQRLTSDNRDRLYEANINPIASFPAEGVVIFGQKTLQVTQSALDRINVRRLLIHVKKEISRFAATTLFEPNIQATWNSFKGRVEPFLDKVKSGFGLVDYKVILDETTTTPDLIDRNILYAKIYLKPARAIEFIALDFIITKSGASFED